MIHTMDNVDVKGEECWFLFKVVHGDLLGKFEKNVTAFFRLREVLKFELWLSIRTYSQYQVPGILSLPPLRSDST